MISSAKSRLPVSIIIPIKNEAHNLPRCLASVAWADEIFVVDSQSTDGSQKIAEANDAKVVQFAFNGTWPKKKNWALENLPFKNEWVFILDADEVLPPEIESEIRSIIEQPDNPYSGYWINRRFRFMGKWLKHAYYPNWNLRLFKHRLGRYEKLTEVDTASGDNEVHEHVAVPGETGFLKSEMDHYAFPSVEVFVEKHNRYSNWEARVALDEFVAGSGEKIQNKEVGLRRKLKSLSHCLPFRPFLRFCYVYFWQRGFLDGQEGYYFARLHAFYEFLSVAKTYELKKNACPSADEPPLTKKRIFMWTLFTVCLIGILFFTLRPSYIYSGRVKEFPFPVARWINLHDDFCNFLAYLFFSFFGFSLKRANPINDKKKFLRQMQYWLVLFLLLVAIVETAQIWIPGRVFDVRDLATGWGGVLVSWIVWRLIFRLTHS